MRSGARNSAWQRESHDGVGQANHRVEMDQFRDGVRGLCDNAKPQRRIEPRCDKVRGQNIKQEQYHRRPQDEPEVVVRRIAVASVEKKSKDCDPATTEHDGYVQSNRDVLHVRIMRGRPSGRKLERSSRVRLRSRSGQHPMLRRDTSTGKYQ